MTTGGHGRKGMSALSGIRLEHVAVLSIYLFAFSWPLGAYQRILGPVHLHQMALVPICICAALDMKRRKRLRTPFELWWPCVAVLVLVGMLQPGERGLFLVRVSGLCLSFIAVNHFVRHRRTALRVLQFSFVSGSIMMVLSVFAQMNLLYPTAYSMETGLVMAGPYSVRDGVATTLVLCFLTPALVMAARNREFSPCRFAVASWLVLPASFVVYVLMMSQWERSLLQPSHALFLFPGVLVVVVMLWGIARVAAKLWVARKYMMPGVYPWLVGGLLLGTLSLLWLAPAASAGLVVLLAAIAGYGQPYVVSGTSARRVPVMILAIGVIVALNMAVLLPGDPRDYERQTQASLMKGDLNGALARLEFVKKRAPEEARADYYIARTYLAAANLPAATRKFVYSLRPVQPRLLPAPDDVLITDFLNEMREKSSALSERMRGVAYEQALIAAGRERHALSLLELRGGTAQRDDMPAGPLAAALATMLEAPSLLESLAQWDAGTLAAILETSGPYSKTVVAPEGFPEHLLPLVVMAQAAPATDTVYVFSTAGQSGGVRFPAEGDTNPADFTLMFSEPGWREWRQNADGIWTLAFGMIAEVHISNTPQVLFGAYPTLPEAASLGYWETAVFLPAQEQP